jgi:hypothetical protein
MAPEVAIKLPAQVWINSLEEGSDDAELEMEDGVATAEITDVDGEGEVAVHFMLGEETQALVSIYMTRQGAAMLGALLTHESAKNSIR